MPEGPEMVFLKEQVEPLIGQVVVQAQGSDVELLLDTLKGQRLTSLSTFGKEIFLGFTDCTIRIHLGFFGKYAINGVVNRALQLGLELEEGTINFYACKYRVLREPLDELYDWSTDIMNPLFDTDQALSKLYRKPDQLICDALLDQSIVAGVGNGIKNEALFRQRIHPESLVGEIPELVLRKLVDECVRISFDYLEWLRERTEASHWQAYMRKQCPRDHIPLRKENIGRAGRPCYFCDKCQRLYLPGNIW
ncbi:DNA-formamidopyrimidine glycosylase family protein [Telluribacter humicola]|uniref:DNA-formamidopyrimidine glycosylase family protein n=1 Tax=Telluribacter humicola TaxID=1720261 RepID=UPI001A961E07|nr:DNA-formamidopyrimidine glycosylase family protein [Telluribacter humicola]